MQRPRTTAEKPQSRRGTVAENETPATETVSTGIALTPRILAGMLTGGNVLGVNWAARFAQIGDGDVFENAYIPTIKGSLGQGGDDILAALLPPQILSEITANEADIDKIRDGVWPRELLETVTAQMAEDEGDACEEIYARCQALMKNANTVVFHFNANYIIHMLSVANLDIPYVRKAVQLYEKFADTDATGALFGLFMLALLGPVGFDKVTARILAD